MLISFPIGTPDAIGEQLTDIIEDATTQVTTTNNPPIYENPNTALSSVIAESIGAGSPANNLNSAAPSYSYHYVSNTLDEVLVDVTVTIEDLNVDGTIDDKDYKATLVNYVSKMDSLVDDVLLEEVTPQEAKKELANIGCLITAIIEGIGYKPDEALVQKIQDAHDFLYYTVSALQESS
jgi:hypothetical protein